MLELTRFSLAALCELSAALRTRESVWEVKVRPPEDVTYLPPAFGERKAAFLRALRWLVDMERVWRVGWDCC